MLDHARVLAVGFGLAVLCAGASAQVTLREWSGATAGDALGFALANLGDLDGDGVDDLALGLPGDDTRASNAGAVSIVSGESQRELRRHLGASAGQRFGTKLTALGDVDGDAIGDLIVAGVLPDQVNLRIWAISGSTGAILWSRQGDVPGDGFATIVAALGDVDQDGVRDVAVSSPRLNPIPFDAYGSAQGRVRVFSGATGGVLLQLDGPTATSTLGIGLSSAGDINADGRADFWVAEYGPLAPNFSRTNYVKAISGATGSTLFVITPPPVADEDQGARVLGGHDLNGDNVPDVIVSSLTSPGQYAGPNHVYAYSGATQTLLWSRQGQTAATQLGVLLHDTGDLNGDGTRDVAASIGGFSPAGYELFSGSSGVSISAPLGVAAGSRILAVCAAGDVNQDGRVDLAYSFATVGFGKPLPAYGPGIAHVLTYASQKVVASKHHVDNRTGGTQSITMAFGPAFGSRPFRVLGSLTGTHAGLPTSAGPLPLTPDAYFWSTARGVNPPYLTLTSGTLNANGLGAATLTIPPNSWRLPAGTVMRHAVVVLDPTGTTVVAVSPAVPFYIHANPCHALPGAIDDCDADDVRDGCEANLFPGSDCNQNARPDSCDIAIGLDSDCDANGVPDDCQSDCNGNSQADACDIALGTSADCNSDGIPDECYVPGLDLNGNQIPDSCEVTTRYVDDDAPLDPAPGWSLISDPLEDGSLSHPFDSLQEAVLASTPLDEIVIEDGLYTGAGNNDLELAGRVGRIRSRNGPQHCVFDMESQYRFSRNVNTSSTRAFSLEGITVMRGFTTSSSSPSGVFAQSQGDIVVRNCHFLDNRSGGLGALSIGTVTSMLVDHCVFARNVGVNTSHGTALKLIGSAGTPAVVRNCLFVDNVTTSFAGSIELVQCAATFEHCTIVGAPALPTHGVVRLTGNASHASQGVFRNCIVRSTANAFFAVLGSTVDVSYTCVTAGAASVAGIGSAGPGVADFDPAFLHAAGGDYHLAAGSLCIDAGDPAFPYQVGMVDGDGEPRVLNGRTDIGWDERP